MTIRVLIADDQALLLAGFRTLIDFADDLDVVGEAPPGVRRWTWSGPAGSTWR
jgi:DNA-binding NarL/FixJ family response regulator